MTGYKDRTWCTYWKDCEKGAGCERALTREVFAQACLWWGNINAPIMQYIERPECWRALNEGEK